MNDGRIPEKGAEAQAKAPETSGKEVKVRMLNIATGEWGIYQPFKTYSMPKERAEAFIKEGKAERV